METSECIRSRADIRSYKADPIPDEAIRAFLEAATQAPSSGNLQNWEFIVVRNADMKQKLSMATHSSRFVKGADTIIIVCYDVELGYRFREDSSIAAEHIHLEATNQGLSSCFVQVCDAGDPVGYAEPYVKKLLNIPDHFRVQCMMPLGYAAGELKTHTEAEYEPAKVHQETF